MLSLSLKRTEALWIGGSRVVLQKLSAGRAGLAIAADDAIPIHRETYLQEIAATDPARLAAMGYSLTPSGAIAAVAPARAA